MTDATYKISSKKDGKTKIYGILCRHVNYGKQFRNTYREVWRLKFTNSTVPINRQISFRVVRPHAEAATVVARTNATPKDATAHTTVKISKSGVDIEYHGNHAVKTNHS